MSPNRPPSLRDVYAQRAREFCQRIAAQGAATHIEDKVSDAIEVDRFGAIEGVVGLMQALEDVQLDPHGHPATDLGTPVHPDKCAVCSFVAKTLGYKPWDGRNPFAVSEASDV
jgi:hypothetical protein